MAGRSFPWLVILASGVFFAVTVSLRAGQLKQRLLSSKQNDFEAMESDRLYMSWVAWSFSTAPLPEAQSEYLNYRARGRHQGDAQHSLKFTEAGSLWSITCPSS